MTRVLGGTCRTFFCIIQFSIVLQGQGDGVNIFFLCRRILTKDFVFCRNCR